MSQVWLKVAARPAPQGSYRRGSHGQIIPASRYLAEWRDAVAGEALVARQSVGRLAGALEAHFRFEMRRPLIHYEGRKRGAAIRDAYAWAYPRAGDLDKLIRSTLDGLVDGGLIADDADVIFIVARKHYADEYGAAIYLEQGGGGSAPWNRPSSGHG